MFKKSAAPSSGYNLTKSLRFRSSASAYLNRTPASNGNLQKITYSTWIKRGVLGYSYATLLSGGTNNVNTDTIAFNSSDNLVLFLNGSSDAYLVTSQVFRDPSAWYHIVIAIDTTQATASNRIKFYVNGNQITAFSTANYPSQNYNFIKLNNASYPQGIGNSGGGYFDGYNVEINFIDGQQLTPSSFGSTNATTGVWQPAKYTGTYGTNGFYLPFTNTTSTTTLGYDLSGNSNNWTTNNFSLTAGSTYDSMTDVPTLTSATVANYEVLSPIDTYDNPPTQGNLTRTGVGHGGSPWSTCRGTLGVSSGKWYFEATLTGSTGSVGNNMVGVMTTTTSTLSDSYGGSTTRSYQANGNLQGNNSTGTVSSASSGDVIMIAFDVDAGKLWVGKNGTWMNSGVPASGTGNVFTTLPTAPIVPQVSMYGNTGDNYGWYMNFGQQGFTYTPPTGFVALNTYNLPTSTIANGRSVMDASLYSGTNATLVINNSDSGTSGFQPDFLWVKRRDTSGSHLLWDSVRGVTLALNSDRNAAEQTATGGTGLASFNSNGFTLGGDFSGTGSSNTSGGTYVGWQWQAGQGTTSSNTNGSITSTVSVNATAGFSVVTYTGNGTANSTVGHGLGVTPNMIITKVRSTTESWAVFHSALLSLGTGYFLELDSTGSASNGNSRYPTAPTSSVYYVGSAGNLTPVNANGQTYVSYCWAAIPGFSAFGSYTGNGSTDGPFVYTGFRPKFVMIKIISGDTDNWTIRDTSRSPYNASTVALYANLSLAEDTPSSGGIDLLSNGFKLRGTSPQMNENSSCNYIYAAFAENPFKNALAR
jgi:hypothetical protein